MLENGTHATIAEIATAEKINETYVGRVLRLTLLAPDIVRIRPSLLHRKRPEQPHHPILGGRQPAEMNSVGKMACLYPTNSQPTEKMCEKQKFAPGFRIAWFRRPAIITSVRDNIRLINK